MLSEANDIFLLQSLFYVNKAQAEHTSTYSCVDVESYCDEYGWRYSTRGRVCSAQDCGRKYYSKWAAGTGTCSVYYN